jgi:hypothetical protein
MPSYINIRKQARKPRIWVAVKGGKSEPTVRAFELNPEGVTEETRAALIPVYRALELTLTERA